MGWHITTDHKGPLMRGLLKAASISEDSVVDSYLYPRRRYAFVAERTPDDGVIGVILHYNRIGKRLEVKDIDESMEPLAIPSGPKARQVKSCLTESQYANPRWRASIV